MMKQAKLRFSNSVRPDATGGFTLIEVTVVVILIAILSAIVAPGWLAFTNRQRVSAVQDEVYQIFQRSRSEALRTKLSQTLTFDPDAKTISVNGAEIQLGQESGVDPDQFTLALPNGLESITFDHEGSVPTLLADDAESFIVTVSVPETTGDSTKRCVAVRTLLGGIERASESLCNAEN